MSAVVPFTFEDNAVRVIERDGEPWFVAKDVASILGYADTAKAAKAHCKSLRPVGVGETPTLDPQTIIIPERDLYRLIMRSKLPSAEKFEEWVVGEVLPAIRKTGSYGAPALPDLSDPAVLTDLLIEHATKRIEAEKRAAQAELAVEAAKPKALFYDAFAKADGLYNLQSAARVLGQSPNKFIGWLKQEYLFYQGAALVPKVQYRQRGYFEVKATIVDDKARHQTFVTPRGIQFLSHQLGLDRLPLEMH